MDATAASTPAILPNTAPFNTDGMYRGHARVGESLRTAIFR